MSKAEVIDILSLNTFKVSVVKLDKQTATKKGR
jgi:hypothetical protein